MKLLLLNQGRVVTLLRGFMLGTALMVASAPLRAQSLADALDGPGLVWETQQSTQTGLDTTTGWTSQSTITHDGTDAARSAAGPDVSSSTLRTRSFTGPGYAVFWRRRGEDSTYSYSTVYVNDRFADSYIPAAQWMPTAIQLPAGPVNLEFRWPGETSSGSGPDTFCYIDEVGFEPPGGPPRFFPADPPDTILGEGYAFYIPAAILGAKPMNLEVYHPGSNFAYTATLNEPNPGDGAYSSFPYGFSMSPSRVGQWRIKATNAEGSIEKTFQVSIVPAAPHSLYIDAPWEAWSGAEMPIKAYPSGTGPFTYQWEFEGVPISGATSDTLVIPSFSAANAGEYQVTVTNALGSRKSAPRRIFLGFSPPVLTQQPDKLNIPLYSGDSLYIQFEGTPPFTTTWKRNGETLSTRTLNYAGDSWWLGGYPDNAPGIYTFSASTGLGSFTTNPMVVQVGKGSDLADALDQTETGWTFSDAWDGSGWVAQTTETSDGTDAAALISSQPASLGTAIAGPATVRFHWKVRSGSLQLLVNDLPASAISVELSQESPWELVQLSLPSGWHNLSWVSGNDGTNVTGAWLDQFTIVKPGAGPVITTQPVSQSLQFTDPLALEATVTASGPLRIQWFRDDVLISDIPASSPGTQTFSAPAAAYLPGAYHLEATDSEGRKSTSDDAIVSVDGNPGSLANLAGAVGYPSGNWSYPEFSPVDGTPCVPGSWYRSQSDGTLAQATRKAARTPSLATAHRAALSLTLDAQSNNLLLRFRYRTEGLGTLRLAIDGIPAAFTQTGTEPGIAGPPWTTAEAVIIPSLPTTITWEAEALQDGTTAWLDHIEVIPMVAPIITQEPQSQQASEGGQVTFSVAAQSTEPISYQWYRLGLGAIPGATQSSLTLSNLQPEDADSYFAVVSNRFGLAVTAYANLIVAPPPPVISNAFAHSWYRPGDPLTLSANVTGGTQPIHYRWYRNGVLIASGSTQFSLPAVSRNDAGTYRLEVEDAFQTVSTSARIVVSPVLYSIRWLDTPDGGAGSYPNAINESGTVVGTGTGHGPLYWLDGQSVGTSLPVATGSSSTMIPVGINDQGTIGAYDYSGARFARWSPPYTISTFEDLGAPPSGGTPTWLALNNRGDFVGMTVSGPATPLNHTYRSFRLTTGSGWIPHGSLIGCTPINGGMDQGGNSTLSMNESGVMVGNTWFEEAQPYSFAQATGWYLDPAAPSPRRISMDTFGADLAISQQRPQGWIDFINDLGDMAARRWSPTTGTDLYILRSDGTVTTVLNKPSGTSPVLGGVSFNVDAGNNRREFAGFLYDGNNIRACLVRNRHAPPGSTPANFSDFLLEDLNDLVPGGTGDYTLGRINGMNDRGQLTGWASGPAGGRGFVLSPIDPYPALTPIAGNDTFLPDASGIVEFSSNDLLANDLGNPPVFFFSISSFTTSGRPVQSLGNGRWRINAANAQNPDSLSYFISDNNFNTAQGLIRIPIPPPPLPPPDGSPWQWLPDDQVRVGLDGLPPNQPVVIEASSTLDGSSWWSTASGVTDNSGRIEVIQIVPPSATRRFFRIRP